jgi:hypothetical protein
MAYQPLEAETRSHPNVYFNIILELCVTDSSIGIPLKGKGKGKPIPFQALTGPEGSRRLRLPDF